MPVLALWGVEGLKWHVGGEGYWGCGLMVVVVTQDYDTMSREAAKIVAEQVRRKPTSVLSLATGATQFGLYAELVRMHREEGLDFSQVTTFNLDEYLGLAPDHPASFHYYMRTRFFDHVNVRPDRIYIPDGLAADIREECRAYERAIRNAGGIDLAVLGVGRNGHIGFNEPRTEFGSRTRALFLAKRTIEANARFFGGDENAVPRQAISVGIRTIMNSRSILLLASGKAKAPVIAQTVHGPVTEMVPSSVLQLHPDATLIVDEEAASQLEPSPEGFVPGPGTRTMVY